MNINLIIKEKPTELDEYLNQDDMELPPFQFALLELSQIGRASCRERE